MNTVIICEKKKQGDKLREAFGNSRGQIVTLQGHVVELMEPHEVRPDWKRWTTETLWPGKLYPTKASTERGKQEILSRVKSALSGADRVIIATDNDREGQLIGDEVLEFFRWKGPAFRALFNAMDKGSLTTAFDNLVPNEQQRKIFWAGQARQQCDQIANFTYSRAFTEVLRKPGAKGHIGIGRVMTPTLAIICQREQDIIDFRPQNYYEILADVDAGEDKVPFRCSGYPKGFGPDGGADEEEEKEEDEEAKSDEALEELTPLIGKIMSKEVADKVVASLSGARPKIAVTSAKKRTAPPALFTLSTLQTAASNAFGWSADKTLDVAQALYNDYEVTTYPRSDVKWLPEADIAEVPNLVAGLLKIPRYERAAPLLEKPEIRKGKTGHFYNAGTKDESHYAIGPNPSVAADIAERVAALPEEPAKLFDMIARRYMAALAPDYEYQKTDASFIHPCAVDAQGEIPWRFTASGSVPVFAGWKAIIGNVSKGDGDLPKMENGVPLPVVSAKTEAKSTKAPARFSDGSIIAMMSQCWRLVPPDNKKMRDRLREAKGIGTTATRGDIIKNMFEQGQILRVGKQVKPSPDSMRLWKLIVQVCPSVADPVRTAVWETLFDSIIRGERSLLEVIEMVADEVTKNVNRLKENAAKMGGGTFGKAGPPSEKMLGFAKRLAEHVGQPLPPGSEKDASLVITFIDKHAEKGPDGKLLPLPPSQKMIDYAKRVSEATGKPIPEEAFKNSGAMRLWVDENQPPPSQKALDYARKLASAAKTSLPAGAETSAAVCRKFIDAMIAKGVKPAFEGDGKPTEAMLNLARKISSESGKALPDDAETSFKACKAFLDANMTGGGGGGGKGAPSEKMLALAEALAAGAKKNLPAAARTSFKACKDFIDAEKKKGTKPVSKSGGGSSGDGKATAGQIKFAEMLAKERNVKIPPGTFDSFSKCREFIEATKSKVTA